MSTHFKKVYVMSKKKEFVKFYVIESNIYAYISIMKKRENRIRLNTELKIEKDFWDTKLQKPKTKYSDYDDLKIDLDKIKKKCIDICNVLIDKYPEIDTQLFFNIKNEFLESYEKIKEKKNISNFWESYEKYIHVKSVDLQPVSIGKLKTIGKHLKDYELQSKRELTFNSIDLNFKDGFYAYLVSINISDNTASRLFGFIRSFMNWAFDRGLHSNQQYKRKQFTVSKFETENIVLTENEIDILHNCKFDNMKFERVRDLFIFQCFVGLRVSDLKRLKRSDFSNGRLHFRVQKTSAPITIILHPFVTEILNKYENEPNPIPIISNQKYNDYLKEVCQIAGIDTDITITKKQGGRKIESTLKKYNLVTTHTARRTFVTMNLEKGMRPEIVMKLSGHTSLSSFKRYIAITDNTLEKEYNRVWGLNESGLKLVSGGL